MKRVKGERVDDWMGGYESDEINLAARRKKLLFTPYKCRAMSFETFGVVCQDCSS